MADILLEVVFWCSVSCTIWGSYYGDRVSVALMCSALLVGGLTAAGAHFALWVWVAVDAITALAIMRRGMPRRDVFIVALFLPGWAAYLFDDPYRFWGSSIIVIVQMLATFPLRQLIGRGARIPKLPDIIDNILPRDAA